MRPTLFTLGGAAVRSYHFFLVVAFLAAFGLFLLEVRRRRLQTGIALDLALFGLFAAVVGGKALYLLAHLGRPRSIGTLLAEGWSGPGLLLGALSGFALFVRHRRLDGFTWADAAAPSLALAETIARIGCFLTGCCHGVPGDVVFAVVFTASEVAPLHVPLHPTQLYHLLLSLGILVFLLFRRKRTRYTGELAVSFAVLFAVARGFVDFFRADALHLAQSPLSVVQIVAVVVAVAGLLLHRRLLRTRGGAHPPREA
ncbi:MAG: prolipoprotein diacylglyceryl transferase [Planctomycetes bacterium]|nr:prolipoprotein diacylglyceryl transferase [Planctomycetota bacterium]